MRRYLIAFFNHEKFIAQFALFIAQSEDLSLKTRDLSLNLAFYRSNASLNLVNLLRHYMKIRPCWFYKVSTIVSDESILFT
jgi:hypothetical protein